MNNFFACSSSNKLAYQVLETLSLIEANGDQNFVYVFDKQESIWSFLKNNSKFLLVDKSDILNLPKINSFYSLGSPNLNKNLISQIDPDNVFFHNKGFSKSSRVLSEEEVYYLKFFKTEMNLFTLHTLLAICLGRQIQKPSEKTEETTEFGIIIPELSNNDELFFWRKVINLLEKKKPVTVFIPEDFQKTLLSYGEFQNCIFKEIKNISFHDKVHWITANNEFAHILAINHQPMTVLYEGEFLARSTNYGPNADYIACDLSIGSFNTFLKYFETFYGQRNFCHRWDQSLETWSRSSWRKTEFHELVFFMYYLYWNFYLREKELLLRPLQNGESITQKRVSNYMNALIEIHNLMTSLKSIAHEETEIDDFEKILRQTNNNFIKVVNTDPILAPIYTSFALTNTSSRNLQFNDILRFYYKKADDIQLLTTVIFELLNSFSQQNNFTINL